MMMRIVAALAALVLAAPAPAQQYPTRPVRLLVGYAAGGGADALARIVAARLGDALGQQIVVDNRPGAGATLAADALAKAAPDGYTLYFADTAILIAPAVYAKLAYDPVTSFAPVGNVVSLPLVFVANPAVPASTAPELIALLKANPGKYSYGSPGFGTVQHLAFELFKKQAGVDVVHIPYKGAAPMVTDLLGGQVSSVILDTASLRPLAQTGKAKVLAMTGWQRATVFPDVPTFLELGYKGFEPVGFFMVLAPAGTPKDIVRKLSDGIARAIRTDDIRNRMLDFGQEPVGSTPEQLAEAIKADGEVFARAIRAANIKVAQNQ